jgi:hypothetical protein
LQKKGLEKLANKLIWFFIFFAKIKLFIFLLLGEKDEVSYFTPFDYF